jgi:hypothetical protein
MPAASPPRGRAGRVGLLGGLLRLRAPLREQLEVAVPVAAIGFTIAGFPQPDRLLRHAELSATCVPVRPAASRSCRRAAGSGDCCPPPPTRPAATSPANHLRTTGGVRSHCSGSRTLAPLAARVGFLAAAEEIAVRECVTAAGGPHRRRGPPVHTLRLRDVDRVHIRSSNPSRPDVHRCRWQSLPVRRGPPWSVRGRLC